MKPIGRRLIEELSANRGVVFIFFAFLFARMSALRNPFYWDEVAAYIPPSLEAARTGLWRALPGLHPKGMFSGHPPFLFLVHGGIYRILGSAIEPHHVVSLAFAAIGVWYTYKTATLVCNRSTGVCAALLLFFSPMFFAQSSMALGDVPITSLGIASIYYLLAERRVAYAVAATLMLQTKETALAVAVAAAIWWFVAHPDERRRWQSIAMHAVPIGSLALFFGLEYVRTGAFVQAHYFDRNALIGIDVTHLRTALPEIARRMDRVLRVVFIGEGRIALTILIALALVMNWRRSLEKPFLALVALTTTLFCAAFGLIVFLPRYAMPALPLLCVAAAWAAWIVVRDRAALQYAVCIAIALFFVPFLFTRSLSGDFETNLQHERVISQMLLATRFADEHLRSTELVADWPVSTYLQMPEMGYVSVPLTNFVEGGKLTPDRTRRLLEDVTVPAAVFYSSLAPSEEMRALRNGAESHGMRVVYRSRSPEVEVVIYSRPAQSDEIR